ncbi:SGNH/GDSL hydrolase family protein [Stenotrophomonas rhizophila]|uniref:SGNH/GDSL hydrolase family protein n=1 Tax=Stenotrophomonas rhizophila TaxID=216778 RepID=UPI0028D1ED22|nr:GDSL-type esterase/lipase family protein [Stenotrophomonas rhizophila]
MKTTSLITAVALGLSALLPASVLAAGRPAMACLDRVVDDLKVQWPNNSTVNIVAFGHSVPAGFGVTPRVHKRDAYPRLLEDALSDRFPFAVLNVITASVGGEESTAGLARVQRDVIDHHPRVVLIDYGLNDRGVPLAQSRKNLVAIIGSARAVGACPVLLTPTWDTEAAPAKPDDKLGQQAAMIRSLGVAEGVPVADSLKAFLAFKGDRKTLMAQSNHPNRAGHSLVLTQLLPLFAPRRTP